MTTVNISKYLARVTKIWKMTQFYCNKFQSRAFDRRHPKCFLFFTVSLPLIPFQTFPSNSYPLLHFRFSFSIFWNVIHSKREKKKFVFDRKFSLRFFDHYESSCRTGGGKRGRKRKALTKGWGFKWRRQRNIFSFFFFKFCFKRF